MTYGLNTDSKIIDLMAVNIDREAFMEQYSVGKITYSVISLLLLHESEVISM